MMDLVIHKRDCSKLKFGEADVCGKFNVDKGAGCPSSAHICTCSAPTGEQLTELVEAADLCRRFLYQRDEMNATVHVAQPRYSPLAALINDALQPFRTETKK